MGDITAAVDYPLLRGRCMQGAQDSLSLLANPTIRLRIVKPDVVCEFMKETNVEIENRLYFVVCHRQTCVDRGRCLQEAADNL